MDLNKVPSYLQENAATMLELVTRLAEINSGSFHIEGLNKIAEIFKHEYATLNCEQVTMPVDEFKDIDLHGETKTLPLGPVLRFTQRPDAPMQILLVGHMDTVYHREHRFQHTYQSGGDILHGPGVADMKGGLVIMLWALKAFEQLPQASKLGWEVILTSDEEVGSTGSSEILAFRAKKHQVGLVFEPSMDENGTLAGQRKGSAKFTLVMHGKAAHAGRSFEEGRNAICKMAEIIGKINALNTQRPGVTLNIGSINGGEAINIVPDRCICKIDVRFPLQADIEWVESSLTQIVASIEPKTGFRCELHGVSERPPKIFDVKMEKLYNIVKKVGHEIGQEISWKPSGGCCDGNNLAANGLPNVDTLGAIGGKIHSEQEFILIPSLVQRAQLVTNLLVYFSENGF